MPKVVSAITATIEVIGKLKQGDYGPYHPVLFLNQAQAPGSEAAKIWKSLSEEEVEPLRKGMKVQLVPAGTGKNGKDKHSIVLLEAKAATTEPNKLRPSGSPSASPSPTAAIVPRPTSIPPTWNTQDKQRLCALVADQADLFKFCVATVQHKMEGLVDSRDQRAIATTLFLQEVNTIPPSALAPEPATAIGALVDQDEIPY